VGKALALFVFVVASAFASPRRSEQMDRLQMEERKGKRKRKMKRKRKRKRKKKRKREMSRLCPYHCLCFSRTL
jgi:hypothetical protein